jgi:hypothetical protein
VEKSFHYFVDQQVINYTVWTVCPSLRESSSAEWRDTTFFLSDDKNPNYKLLLPHHCIPNISPCRVVP